MRWAVFGLFAFLTLAVDTSLSDVVAIGGLRPSSCALLAVFIALTAPRLPALWACFVLGLLLDLSSPLTLPGDRILYLIGPYALGYVVGGYLVVHGRTMVFRRRPLTLGVMTFVCLLAVHVVVVAMYVIRSWYSGGPLAWADTTLAGGLFQRFFIALYSGVFAIPLGWLLVRTMPLWGFQMLGQRTG